MLVFGLLPDPPWIDAQMVMGDSTVFGWSGRVKEDNLQMFLQFACTLRCIYAFDVTAAAESKLVTFNMAIDGGRITFMMERDPDARAEKPVKALKSR